MRQYGSRDWLEQFKNVMQQDLRIFPREDLEPEVAAVIERLVP